MLKKKTQKLGHRKQDYLLNTQMMSFNSLRLCCASLVPCVPKWLLAGGVGAGLEEEGAGKEEMGVYISMEKDTAGVACW